MQRYFSQLFKIGKTNILKMDVINILQTGRFVVSIKYLLSKPPLSYVKFVQVIVFLP